MNSHLFAKLVIYFIYSVVPIVKKANFLTTHQSWDRGHHDPVVAISWDTARIFLPSPCRLFQWVVETLKRSSYWKLKHVFPWAYNWTKSAELAVLNEPGYLWSNTPQNVQLNLSKNIWFLNQIVILVHVIKASHCLNVSIATQFSLLQF